MALEGTLGEFGISDILQLIYYQRKSGVLRVEAAFDLVTILFYEGNIVFVESGRRSESRLGRLLLKKGLVKEEDLKGALELQKTAGAKLGSALVRMGAISAEVLRETLVQQFTELVGYLFTWKRGRYQFKPQGVPIDKDMPISLDTQQILLEGLRILDEWSQVDGSITLESVFAKAGGPPAGLDETEKRIYDLVDGENDVNEIAGIGGMDSFRASKTLLDLYEKGLIEKRGSPAGPVRDKSVNKSEGPPAERAKGRLPVLVLEAVLAALFLISAAQFYAGLSSGPAASKTYLASERIDRLSFLVRAYKAENGRYPEDLGRVDGHTDPWGNPYVYKASDCGFTLFSSGPNGAAGTREERIY